MSSSSIALPLSGSVPGAQGLTAEWLTPLSRYLSSDETPVAVLPTDLDHTLRARRALVVLTNQRLFEFQQPAEGSSPVVVQSFALTSGMVLQLHDHAGVAVMELMDGARRLGSWRFTLGVNLHAQRLVSLFSQVKAGQSPSALDAEEADDVPNFAAEVEQPPSTWTLLRLWRFARPYQWQLLSGFLLMLASTAATLVPPYLTMPLMDEILI